MLAATVVTRAGAGTTVNGAPFESLTAVGEQQLVLNGAGLLRYRWLVKVYAAALYVPPDLGDRDVLGDVPKRLEVAYFVSAPAKEFNAAGDAVLERALPAGEYVALLPRLNTLKALYPDPEPGDRCAITYQPGKGTTLTFNGEALGTIPGEDFQRAYFGIWLGDVCASEDLRNALLGTRRR